MISKIGHRSVPKVRPVNSLSPIVQIVDTHTRLALDIVFSTAGLTFGADLIANAGLTFGAYPQ